MATARDALLPRDLVVLGSGTALPTAGRGSPGYLLRFGDGRGVLLDAGPGSVRAAARHGVGVDRLAGALITHFHPDHTLDLFALIFGHKSPFLAGSRLVLVGPRGLADLVERMKAVYGAWVELGADRLRVCEIGAGELAVELLGLRLAGCAVAMPHLAHSLGYRLLRRGRRHPAFSGDTGMGEGPIALGRAAITICSRPRSRIDGDGPPHPPLAGRVARRCGAPPPVVTPSSATEQLDVAAQVTPRIRWPLTIAHDGLVLEF
ncbi:MAG: MBL fold metallo-hydrolase [Planctomycetota bacterium]